MKLALLLAPRRLAKRSTSLSFRSLLYFTYLRRLSDILGALRAVARFSRLSFMINHHAGQGHETEVERRCCIQSLTALGHQRPTAGGLVTGHWYLVSGNDWFAILVFGMCSYQLHKSTLALLADWRDDHIRPLG